VYKLNFYGITGKVYAWIKSYFRDRYQKSRYKNKNSNNAYSDWGAVKYGVTLGTI
jgi:hypothetical protein